MSLFTARLPGPEGRSREYAGSRSRLVILGTLVAVCHSAEVLATAGSYKRYLDEPAALSYGVSAKIPVTRRIAVRPEFLADSDKVYSNLLALGSLTGDSPMPGRTQWATGLPAVDLCGRERRLSLSMLGIG